MTLRKEKVILINRWGVNANFIAAKLCLQVQAYIYGKGDCGFIHKVKHRIQIQCLDNINVGVMVQTEKRLIAWLMWDTHAHVC